MSIIANIIRWTASGDPVRRMSAMADGKICQATPKRSLSQLHWTSGPPPLSSPAQI